MALLGPPEKFLLDAGDDIMAFFGAMSYQFV